LQDERALGAGVGDFATLIGCHRKRCQPLLIEAHDQLAYTISALQASLIGCYGKGLPTRHRHQCFGSAYHIKSLAGGFGQSVQFLLFLFT
jgi:hypothetical protein